MVHILKIAHFFSHVVRKLFKFSIFISLTLREIFYINKIKWQAHIIIIFTHIRSVVPDRGLSWEDVGIMGSWVLKWQETR